MKNLLLLLLGSMIMLALSCSEDNFETEVDPSIQRAIDIALINEYLIDTGFSGSINDTTLLGVRYIILEDSGRSESSTCGEGCIDESDNVKFRYTGMLLDGNIFDTSVKSIGDSLNLYYKNNPYIIDGDTASLFPDSKQYLTSELTYSASGWSVTGYITGFKDGIVNTFNKLNVGGTARIIIPSDLGYGATTPSVLIPTNSVLIFDLYPVKVEKQ